MKIAILGAGAIGSLFGAYLSQKNEIFFVGRKEHVEKINKYGLKIEGLRNFTVFGKGYTEYPGGADVIFLTVKSYDTENAMESIKGKLKNEFIISLQNGLGNVDIIKRYTRNVIAAITTEGATFLSPGIVKHTGSGITKVGEIFPEHRNFAKKISQMLKDCGLKSEYTDKIINEILIKGAINSCINPLTAILEIKNGGLLDETLSPILDSLIRENEFFLNSLGINIDLKKKVYDVIKNTAENYSSMLQDILKGKKTEIESITGKILELSHEKNVDMKISEVLFYLAKEKEKLKIKKV